MQCKESSTNNVNLFFVIRVLRCNLIPRVTLEAPSLSKLMVLPVEVRAKVCTENSKLMERERVLRRNSVDPAWHRVLWCSVWLRGWSPCRIYQVVWKCHIEKSQGGHLESNRTETYLDWILSETGIDEPTEAPATTPTTAVPTEPPTTLPPFICPDGWVDSNTGCFKLLHTEVKT